MKVRCSTVFRTLTPGPRPGWARVGPGLATPLILCIARVTNPSITLFWGDAVESTSDYRHGIIQYLQDWVMFLEVALDITKGFFNGVIAWAIGRKEQEEYTCCIKNVNHSLDMVYRTIVHDCNSLRICAIKGQHVRN